MKKLLLLLSLFLIISTTGCANKTPPKVSKNPVSDFNYTTDEYKSYIIIKKYLGSNKQIIIPEKIQGLPVKIISFETFINSDIESVTIPDTVEKILGNSFANCSKLHTVILGDNIKIIEKEAFRKCVNLKNIKLPSNLEEIGNYAFADCSELRKIFIPKKVSKMGMCAFYNSGLSSVTFEEGLEKVGSYACFWCGSNLANVTFPASIKEIGEYCFSDELKEAHFLGDAPEVLGDHPFGDNTIIYFKSNTQGWETTPLKEYRLIKN